MTPSAATSAGRRKSATPAPLRAPEVAPVPRRRREVREEIRITRRSASVRRVSGPVSAGGSVAAAVAQPLATPQRRPVPTGPERLIRAVGAAPDHRITIGLVSSRGWIALLAAGALMIVFMQVHLMNVNRGIGVDVQRVSQLQLENSQLKAEVSGLSSDQRIVAAAQRLGFVEPPVGSSRFTKAASGDAARSLSIMSAATNPQLEQVGTLRSGPSSSGGPSTDGSPVGDTNGNGG